MNTPRASTCFLSLPLTFSLCACLVGCDGEWDVQIDSESPGEKVVGMQASDAWTASGVEVVAGACYTVSATIDDQWLDADEQANLDGWLETDHPLFLLFELLRRVPDPAIGFYQLAACVDRKLDACFAIGAGATICPDRPGELFFFVNDVPGFEGNNVGSATIKIQPED